MVGCNRSGAIFAINKDKNAPIFKQCDFGLVGDIKDVLPAITAACKGDSFRIALQRKPLCENLSKVRPLQRFDPSKDSTSNKMTPLHLG